VVGQPVKLLLTYTNTSDHPCLGNTGSKAAGCHDLQVYQADGNGQAQSLVWDEYGDQPTPPCPPGAFMQVLAPGASATTTVLWSQTSCPGASSATCPESQVPSGHYLVWGTWSFLPLGAQASTFDIIGS
jgi:hypothetical protein